MPLCLDLITIVLHNVKDVENIDNFIQLPLSVILINSAISL